MSTLFFSVGTTVTFRTTGRGNYSDLRTGVITNSNLGRGRVQLREVRADGSEGELVTPYAKHCTAV